MLQFSGVVWTRTEDAHGTVSVSDLGTTLCLTLGEMLSTQLKITGIRVFQGKLSNSAGWDSELWARCVVCFP